MLEGANAMDQATRQPEARQNPAVLLALAWRHATGGTGAKDITVASGKPATVKSCRAAIGVQTGHAGRAAQNIDTPGPRYHRREAVIASGVRMIE